MKKNIIKQYNTHKVTNKAALEYAQGHLHDAIFKYGRLPHEPGRALTFLTPHGDVCLVVDSGGATERDPYQVSWFNFRGQPYPLYDCDEYVAGVWPKKAVRK